MTTLNPRGAQPPFDVKLIELYRGRPWGASRVTLGLTGTPTALITAAANVNGAVIRTLVLQPPANEYGAVHISASAPSAWNDTAKSAVLRSYSSQARDLAGPLYVPAGAAVWASASNSGGFADCSYDLL